MKLKVRPEDFEVEELIRLRPNPVGQYSIYRLEKHLWNTLDVLDFVARRYGLRRLARAGLKDRYAHSIQYVSTQGPGPDRIIEKNFSLTLVGRACEPVSRDLLIGNRFRIVLRDLSQQETETIARNLPHVREDGLPNYYDEQRFGSARHGAGFIALKLILGHYNGALKLHLATPSAADDSATRRTKTFLRDHWGAWPLCRDHAGPEFRPIFEYLVHHPRDFAGAVEKIRRDWLELFLNAYQSYLWNETLAELFLSFGLKTEAVGFSGGRLLFYRSLNPKARQFFDRHPIPVASPKTQVLSSRIEKALNTVLLSEGLTLRGMKLKQRIRGVYFKPFFRPGLVWPQQLRVSVPARDELYPNRKKLELRCVLPPGSYATILVKRLLIPSPDPARRSCPKVVPNPSGPCDPAT